LIQIEKRDGTPTNLISVGDIFVMLLCAGISRRNEQSPSA